MRILARLPLHAITFYETDPARADRPESWVLDPSSSACKRPAPIGPLGPKCFRRDQTLQPQARQAWRKRSGPEIRFALLEGRSGWNAIRATGPPSSGGDVLLAPSETAAACGYHRRRHPTYRRLELYLRSCPLLESAPSKSDRAIRRGQRRSSTELRHLARTYPARILLSAGTPRLNHGSAFDQPVRSFCLNQANGLPLFLPRGISIIR